MKNLNTIDYKNVNEITIQSINLIKDEFYELFPKEQKTLTNAFNNYLQKEIEEEGNKEDSTAYNFLKKYLPSFLFK